MSLSNPEGRTFPMARGYGANSRNQGYTQASGGALCKTPTRVMIGDHSPLRPHRKRDAAMRREAEPIGDIRPFDHPLP